MMSDSEVDLFQIMNIIWKKKIQILLYTVLIVLGAVLFTYIQPRYYETHMTAFILPSGGNTSVPQNAYPLEYYVKFSKAPEILNGVLEKLPDDVKFESNKSPLDNLSSMLRVESKFIPATTGLSLPTFQLTYYVRHIDPVFVYQIAKIWKEVLSSKISQFDKDVTTKNFLEQEKQHKLSKAKWEESKKRLIDHTKNYNIPNKKRKLNSLRRLTAKMYHDYEILVGGKFEEIYAAQIKAYEAEIKAVNKSYLRGLETLAEHRRLLKFQPQAIKLSDIHAKKYYEKNKILNLSGQDDNLNEQGDKRVFNPVYLELQDKIIVGEAQKKQFQKQEVRLKRLVMNLKSVAIQNNRSLDDSEISKQQNQIKLLEDKIKKIELESSNLDAEIFQKKDEYKTFGHRMDAAAVIAKSKFKKYEELRMINTLKPRGVEFAPSVLESALLLAPSLRTTIFLAFGSGLIFTILITLIKSDFGAQGMNKNSARPNDSQYPDSFSDDVESNNIRIEKDKKTIPSSKVSGTWKESTPQYFPASTSVGFAKDR